jgi:predicted transcriptional regulator
MSLQCLNDNKISMLDTIHELLDSVSYHIILSIVDYAKPVVEISLENKIPLSSTYKKIKRLTSHGLVHVEKIIIDDAGKKVILYKSTIKGMQVDIEQGNVNIKFENLLHVLIASRDVDLYGKPHGKEMYMV